MLCRTKALFSAVRFVAQVDGSLLLSAVFFFFLLVFLLLSALPCRGLRSLSYKLPNQADTLRSGRSGLPALPERSWRRRDCRYIITVGSRQ